MRRELWQAEHMTDADVIADAKQQISGGLLEKATSHQHPHLAPRPMRRRGKPYLRPWAPALIGVTLSHSELLPLSPETDKETVCAMSGSIMRPDDAAGAACTGQTRAILQSHTSHSSIMEETLIEQKPWTRN